MAQTKLLVIIGITGQQGSSVYNHFKNEPGWRIRGITRNPDKHQHLKAENVELVAGDLDDEVSIEKAFENANTIYANTDFWQFLKQPATFERAEKEGKLPNQIAMELEIEQGKTIVRAAASQLATLDRLVLSTLGDSVKWSQGEITWNLHFDGKAKYTEYLKQTYPALAAKTSYLFMGQYLSNWRNFPVFTPRKQEDGSFIMPNYLPPGYGRMPWVAPEKDAGVFAKALVLAHPARTSMLGYSQMLSSEEYCAIWGRVHGVRCTPQYLDIEGLVAGGMPEWLARETEAMGLFVAKFGQAGGDPEVREPAELGVDVKVLTSVEQAIRADDWSSVL